MKESFYKKFPDSERGPLKDRASFLGTDFGDTTRDARDDTTFQDLTKMLKSPTKGNKNAFSKTPRAKVGGDGSPAEEQPVPEEGQTQAAVSSRNDKKGIFWMLLSKYLNKK
eukprot:gb/GEZJ01001596.1/.p1 GENE.gb/GEZJ01001596.1/~~gb/GEZJ01001596.1/.p1  ORF type:complete len:111 (-),score=24.16 gb/GEZJ01001596.1/:430-762(-)